MPIETAAYESGFNDPKYFARVVKSRFGCTPRALKAYGK
ncbi:MAG: AraC family transcriptional regulator [Kiritimatiellae bacterium]|nr:AraC family transcriptional regulator [Kiritimatiellia bacterium]